MRLFEIILLLISTVFPFYISTRGYRFNKKFPLIIIGGLIVLHFIFEGYRWQMIPGYLMTLILVWCLYKELLFFKGGWIKKTIRGLTFFIILILAWGLPYVLPVFSLPTPTGKYKIGSDYIHLKTDREEKITENSDDKRELMIKVWYPAEVKNEEKEPYLNDGERIGFAEKYGLPKSTFNYLDYVETHTYKSPEVANGKFPVLIFSHGYYSIASGYYAIIEELVSHGYIVMNINHTYESTGTLFPDGTIQLYHKEYDEKHVSTQQMGELAWKSRQDFNNAKTEEEKLLISNHILKNYIAAEITKRWSKDISSVINELDTWNKASFLANHIDTNKIGVCGHSQGGSAIGQSILENNRIVAGVSLDGVQWGDMIDSTLTKPFLIISSDWKYPHPNFNTYAFRNGSSIAFYDAKIKNSGHASFMDIPLMVHLQFINESGTINPYKAFRLTTDALLQFFDMYLLGHPTNLTDLKTKYGEFEIIQKE
ncbi:alpha/beta hydrolase family protein [Thermophagus sp. OGC60D27]|uniref:alpha/beta hydrolase family protein n=1 Tax=Thermophagus sp. OGC60D27 TaxID=3458415 RepID=UPI004037DFFA